MTISAGDKLPEATLLQRGADKTEPVDLAARLRGRKVVLFGLPGAFTGTCTTAHVPSFIRTKPGFDAKGVDEIICVSVNDPFVMQAWGASTGAVAGSTVPGACNGSDARSDSAASSASLVITTMLMRRLIGFCGLALSNSTEDANPTTRATLAGSMPPSSSARRAALARSALSSQLP